SYVLPAPASDTISIRLDLRSSSHLKPAGRPQCVHCGVSSILAMSSSDKSRNEREIRGALAVMSAKLLYAILDMEGVAHPHASVERKLKVFFGCFMGRETKGAHLTAGKIGQIGRISGRDLTAPTDCFTKFCHQGSGQIGTANEIPGVLQEVRMSQDFLVA